ncbi:MAG: response regulator, partial [Lachnospiraceae bacterium]|nr:response regulator [Lachnospiraceae bacterium]
YGFVHKMGGFVMINSEKKKGTTVRLTIPQKVVDMSPCLMTNDNVKDGLVFYSRLDKFKVPEVRDFYKNMVINLATGLKTRLYSASDRKELEHLLEEMDVSHIFMGVEEYEAEADWIEQLSRDGYKIVVSADAGFKVSDGSRVLVMQKPLYAFPVVRILNGEEDNNINSNQEEKIYFPGVSALVVDDEPMNLVVASGLFRDYKMIVDSAESGKEAIRKYESGSYDIIFMDHMMPEMDGVETMKQIRQIALSDGRTPIIVALTANALSGAKEMFIKEGFDGFIAKPIDIIEFERVMKRVLPETAKFVNGGEN